MRACLIIIFFLQFISFSNAQFSTTFRETDYLKHQDKIRYYISNVPDSTLIYCNYLRKTAVPVYVIYSHAAEAYYHALYGTKKEETEHLTIANKLLARLTNTRQKKELTATILNFEGSIYKQHTDFKGATAKYIAGQKLAQELENSVLEIRFIHNLADIKAQMGRLREAIQQTKEGLTLLETNSSSFTQENYTLYKSNTYINLGRFYNDLFHQNKQSNLIDSALNYYHKALYYTEKNSYNESLIYLNIGGLAITQKEFSKAITSFEKVLRFSKENNLLSEEKKAIYNLAIAHFETKKYTLSLAYFKQFDSLYKVDPIELNEFIKSNYFQSKIYRLKGDKEQAYKHSDIYLENYARLLKEQSETKINVSEQMTQQRYQKEMQAIQKSNEASSKMIIYISLGGVGIACILIFLIIRLKRDKKSMKLKMDSTNKPEEVKRKHSEKSIKIDSEIENEILAGLKKLEAEHVYLRHDYNLQYVAKRLKTNTSYLSHIVNQRFNQTFSEYSNDLKINYVVSKLERDSKYRAFSTQAIAESVGFKNAVSFTKSFQKKTGLTPFQYSKKIDGSEVSA